MLFLLEAAAVRRLFRTSYAWALPFAGCLVICVLYAFGLLERLHWGLYALVLMAAAGLFFEVRALILRKGKVRIPAGLVFMLAVFLFALLTQRRETIYGWDEGAHWIPTVKNSYVLNRLGASRYSNLLSSYKMYLPGAALFEYFFAKLTGPYSNAAVRIGLCVLTASFLAPALAAFDGEERAHPFKRCTVGLILFFVPFAMFRHAYNSVTVDCVLGLAMAYTIYAALRLEGAFGCLSVGVGVITIGLIKDSGVLLGTVCAIAACVRMLPGKRSGLSEKAPSRRLMLAIGIALLALPFLTKLSWALYLWRQGVDFSRALLGYETRAPLLGPYTDFGIAGFGNYYKALLYDCSFSDSTKFYVSIFCVPYSVWLLIVSALFLLNRRLTPAAERGTQARVLTVFYVGNLVWIIGTSLLYLNDFSEGEVAELSSMSRYLGTYLLALYAVGAALLFERLAGRNWKSKQIAALIIAALLLPNPAPLVSQAYFKTHRARALLDPADTAEDVEFADAMRRYEPLAPYLAERNTILLLYGHGNIHWLMVAVAPTDCYRAGTPEALIDRAKDHPGKDFFMYIDMDAHIARLQDSVFLHNLNGELQNEALYAIEFEPDGAGFSIEFIADRAKMAGDTRP